MGMSRKDYELIASELRKAYRGWGEDSEGTSQRIALLLFAESLSRRLLEDNVRFDRRRFLTAAGMEGLP